MVREVTIEDGNQAPARAAQLNGRLKKPKKRKTAVFIDGSNLYFKLRQAIPHKMDFIKYKYRELALSLLHDDETLAYIGYYVGVVRDTKRTSNHEKTLELVKNQQKLFDQLRHQRIAVVKGYLLERDGRYFEKGVDVRLAVDIVTMAQAKQYDTAVVLSSDTDLIPAIQAAQKLKRTVAYVGFGHQPSLALIRQSDRSHLITHKEAARYLQPDLTVKRFDEDVAGEETNAK